MSDWVKERPSWVQDGSIVRVKFAHQKKTAWIQFNRREDGSWLAYQFGLLIPVAIPAIEAYWDHNVEADFIDYGD